MELKKYKDKLTEHTYYEKDGKVVRHGIGKGYYLNGELESEYNYKNGKRHGLCKYYYANGKLESEHNYKNGKRHGLCEIYYANGKLESENNFKNGKIINFKGYGIWGRIKTIVYMMYHGRRSYIKGVTLNVIAIGRKVLGRY